MGKVDGCEVEEDNKCELVKISWKLLGWNGVYVCYLENGSG